MGGAITALRGKRFDSSARLASLIAFRGAPQGTTERRNSVHIVGKLTGFHSFPRCTNVVLPQE